MLTDRIPVVVQVIAIIWFIAFLVGLTFAGFLFYSNYIERKHITGTLVDFETGESLADVTISAVRSDWGFSKNRTLVWNHLYVTRAISDSLGSFKLEYQIGTHATLTVDSPLFASYQTYHPPGSDVKIQLQRIPEGASPLTDHALRIGIDEDGRPFGWDFSEKKPSFVIEEADIFPIEISLEPRGRIVLASSGSGGVNLKPASKYPTKRNLIYCVDEAPLVGYGNTETLDFADGGGILLVRTRDGRHYAKIEFDPTMVWSGSTVSDTRKLIMRYVYDRQGGRILFTRSLWTP